MKTIDVTTREWFDKVNGNSYFTSVITTDYGMETEKVISVPFTYGYGSFHEQNAAVVLGLGDVCLSAWCRENGIILRSIKIQVNRKKDLNCFR